MKTVHAWQLTDSMPRGLTVGGKNFGLHVLSEVDASDSRDATTVAQKLLGNEAVAVIWI